MQANVQVKTKILCHIPTRMHTKSHIFKKLGFTTTIQEYFADYYTNMAGFSLHAGLGQFGFHRFQFPVFGSILPNDGFSWGGGVLKIHFQKHWKKPWLNLVIR